MVAIKTSFIRSPMFGALMVVLMWPTAAFSQAPQPLPMLKNTEPMILNPAKVDPQIAEEFYQRGHDAMTSGDDEQAAKEFLVSCGAGNFKSCFNAGLFFEKHRATDLKRNTNRKTALSLFDQSCAGGFQRACVVAARYYRSLNDGVNDYPRAMALLNAACAADEIGGCEDLAEMLYRGIGGSADLPRAASLFKKSCDGGGLALSCFNYGLMRNKGQGGAIDDAASLAYYRLACRKGSSEGCINLAGHYSERGTFSEDKKIGRDLMRQTCTKGSVVGCANLEIGRAHV